MKELNRGIFVLACVACMVMAGLAGYLIWGQPPAVGPEIRCQGNRYNCADFSSCEEIWDYFIACPGDPSYLDGDKDGFPCEAQCK